MLKKKFVRTNSNQFDKSYACTIRFLDDSEPLSFAYQKETRGQEIFDQVCHCLDLVERDYFGLRYIDQDKQRHWLDLLKPVYKQLKYVNPLILCFRLKFYPSDPMKLKEEITRYFIFLQLRRDLHHGRLLCSQHDANLLAAFILQSEIGDSDSDAQPPNYVSKFKMLPKQSHKQEEKIREIHKTLVGQTAAEVELNFLLKSATLDTYGVDPHPVKDSNGNLSYLGITHLGIVTFQGSKRTRIFTWVQIKKITFEGKMFIAHVSIQEKGTGLFDSGQCMLIRHVFGYKCPTLNACKHLWKCAVEQQYFFTLDSAKHAPKVVSGGGVFTRGSRFKFSGRCEKETYMMELHDRDEPRFIRTSSNPLFAQKCSSLRSGSVPATFNVLGLSEESLDSLNNYKHGGNWRSMENISRSSTPQPQDNNNNDILHNNNNDLLQNNPDFASPYMPQEEFNPHNNDNPPDNNDNPLDNNEDASMPQSGFSLFDSFHQDISGYLGNRYNKDHMYTNNNEDGFFRKDGGLVSRVSVETQDSSSTRYRKKLPLKHQPKTLYDESTEYKNTNFNNNYLNNNNYHHNNINYHQNNNFNNSYQSNLKVLSNQATHPTASAGNKRNILHCFLLPVLVIIVIVVSFIIYTELYVKDGQKKEVMEDEKDEVQNDEN